jgi:general secretion pathway protein G
MNNQPSFQRRRVLGARRLPSFHGRKATRGFSLLEIVVVISLIGVILGVVAAKIMGNQDRAKWRLAETHLSTIAGKIDQYQADTGALPSTLDQLVTSPQGVSGWLGPYAKAEELKDPWMKPLTLKVPGDNGAQFQVVSLGKDGQPGGEGVDADIVKP